MIKRGNIMIIIGKEPFKRQSRVSLYTKEDVYQFALRSETEHLFDLCAQFEDMRGVPAGSGVRASASSNRLIICSAVAPPTAPVPPNRT